jgi:hypothetical protein
MRPLLLGSVSLSLACGFDSSGLSGGAESGSLSTGNALESTGTSSADVSTTTPSTATTSSDPSVTATTGFDDSSTTTASGDDSSSGDDPSRGTSSESTGAPPQSPWCDAARDDLVACYAFADLASGVLVDDAAPGIDGSVTNIVIEDGPLGEAAVFSADSEVQVPASSATDLPEAVTIELFLRVDAIPGGNRAGILDRDGQWSVFLYADGQVRCGASDFTYAALPSVGDWLHVGCVVGDGWARLYFDGVLASEVTDDGGILTGNGNPLAIGDNSPGFDEPLAGAIGGLRIWSTTRTGEELCDGAGERCE